MEYLHNPLGQRIARKVNGQIVEKYHWLNLTTLLATYDANGNVLQRYEYAGGRTPTKLTQGTQTYYILSDYQGTPKLVTDSAGAVVKELSYDSFGNVIQDSNPTFRLPFGYAGGLYDPETQLVRFGHRDYDTDAGRWTAKDPIGFGGGQLNLYNYVLADPVNFIDTTGLAVGDPINRSGPTDQSGRTGRTGSPISSPPGGSKINNPNTPLPQKAGRKVLNAIAKKATGRMVGVDKYGLWKATPLGWAIGALVTPTEMGCSTLDCDGDGKDDVTGEPLAQSDTTNDSELKVCP